MVVTILLALIAGASWIYAAGFLIGYSVGHREMPEAHW